MLQLHICWSLMMWNGIKAITFRSALGNLSHGPFHPNKKYSKQDPASSCLGMLVKMNFSTHQKYTRNIFFKTDSCFSFCNFYVSACWLSLGTFCLTKKLMRTLCHQNLLAHTQLPLNWWSAYAREIKGRYKWADRAK